MKKTNSEEKKPINERKVYRDIQYNFSYKKAKAEADEKNRDFLRKQDYLTLKRLYHGVEETRENKPFTALTSKEARRINSIFEIRKRYYKLRKRRIEKYGGLVHISGDKFFVSGTMYAEVKISNVWLHRSMSISLIKGHKRRFAHKRDAQNFFIYTAWKDFSRILQSDRMIQEIGDLDTLFLYDNFGNKIICFSGRGRHSGEISGIY